MGRKETEVSRERDRKARGAGCCGAHLVVLAEKKKQAGSLKGRNQNKGFKVPGIDGEQTSRESETVSGWCGAYQSESGRDLGNSLGQILPALLLSALAREGCPSRADLGIPGLNDQVPLMRSSDHSLC